MKKILKFILLLSVYISMGGLFSGCTDEMPVPFNDRSESLIVKKPEITPTGDWFNSNSYYFNKTRSANVNGNQWYETWERPTNVTQEEIDAVLEAIKSPRVNAVNTIHINWENYWVQQVYTGQQTYKDGNNSDIGAGSSYMNHLLAYSGVQWNNGYDHINNFNHGKNDTEYVDGENKEVYKGTTLMTDMHAENIEKQFGYNNSRDSQDHFEYIIIQVNGNYYVCFDFYACPPVGQEVNRNMSVERDWIFDDWIVKISPAYHKGEGPTTPPAKDEPIIKNHDNEVEVNLSVEDHDYLASHLSIHVRYAGDVEIFLPVPKYYYCDTDDMTIVMKHDEDFIKYGVEEYETSWNVRNSGYEVKIKVTYEEDGIRIVTSGVNQNVIDLCKEECQDGITFEVWNYFNENIDKDMLKHLLDNATIKFLGENLPEEYINAFNKKEDDSIFEWDCTVNIEESQSNLYEGPITGEHLNASPYNEIYAKKD